LTLEAVLHKFILSFKTKQVAGKPARRHIMKILSVLILALGFGLNANAFELSFSQTKRFNLDAAVNLEVASADEAYHTIESITVTEVESLEPAPSAENYVLQEKGLGEIIMSIDKLLALGKKIWAIVEAGRPVVQTAFAPTVSVLPNVENPNMAFGEMENWSMPKVKTYRVVYKNLLGMEVVAFTYGVYYQHGGTYQGKGAYLTGVNVNARDVKVSWGFEFNAASTVVAIANRGSSANPNAGLTIRINYLAKSVLREIRSSESFHVAGNGEFAVIR
jgi:hypothetical protein